MTHLTMGEYKSHLTIERYAPDGEALWALSQVERMFDLRVMYVNYLSVSLSIDFALLASASIAQTVLITDTISV